MASLNILFLCTNNSTRSILAEALLNHLGAGRVRGYSAGSHPRGSANPLALQLLKHSRIAHEGLVSKSWDVFTASDAPVMDLVITVCDQAAGEVCPIWPGGPMKAHWSINKSATKTNSADEALAGMEQMRQQLEMRIRRLLELPLETMDPTLLRTEVNRIGAMD